MKYIKYYAAIFLAGCLLLFIPASDAAGAAGTDQKTSSDGVSSSPKDINLRTNDGYNYTFTYRGEDYSVIYTNGSWRIYDSWRIMNPIDILTICTALSEEHPVPSSDHTSYRTPSDMAYEWIQHNIAYLELPESSYLRRDAKNVDLDPRDQGKSPKEFYEDRTGQELDNADLLDKIIEELTERFFDG